MNSIPFGSKHPNAPLKLPSMMMEQLRLVLPKLTVAVFEKAPEGSDFKPMSLTGPDGEKKTYYFSPEQMKQAQLAASTLVMLQPYLETPDPADDQRFDRKPNEISSETDEKKEVP